jgi:hypothetical protein
MDYEDKLYLLKKRQIELRNEYNEFQARKDLYERMVQLTNEFQVRSSQERFLLGDLHRLINFFEQKGEITLLKLRDVDSEINGR